MNPTIYEASSRQATTRRTWLAAGGAAVALLVVLALVVAAYQARGNDADPVVGAAGTPTATAPAPTATAEAGEAEDTDEAGENSGQNSGSQTGGNQNGGNQNGGENDDGEEGEEGEDDDELPPALDFSAKASASVTPAQHHAINCNPTNITIKGTITLTGGLWLPGPPPTKVTVEYRWILDGEVGLAQAVHFDSPGEQAVSTSMSMTGNATAAIEILSPNPSTSSAATIHLFCQ